MMAAMQLQYVLIIGLINPPPILAYAAANTGKGEKSKQSVKTEHTL